MNRMKQAIKGWSGGFRGYAGGMALLCLFLPTVGLAENTSQENLTAVFRLGEPLGAQALQDVSAKLAEVQSDPADARLTLAQGLVLAHQKQYEQAERVLVDLTPAERDQLPAAQAKIWLLVMNRKYPAALEAMQLAAQALASAPAQDQQEQAEFLGRMFGYLEGPAAGSFKPRTLHAERDKLVAALPALQYSSFQRGADSVANEYAKLVAERDEQQSQARDVAEASLSRQREELANAKQKLEKNQDQLEASHDLRQQSTSEKLRQLDKEGVALQEQLDYVQARSYPLVTKLQAVQATPLPVLSGAYRSYGTGVKTSYSYIQRTLPCGRTRTVQVPSSQTVAPYTENGVTENLQYPIYQDAIIDSVNARLAPLQSEAIHLTGARNSVEVQKSRIADENAEEKEDYREQRADFNRLNKQLTNQGKEIDSKKGLGNTPQVAALNKTIKGLTTYEPFPYEELRQRMLTQ